MVRGNILKKTKRRPVKRKIYGFDVETCDNNKQFVCASIYESDDKVWFFTDKRELITFLKTKRFWNSYIVATNLQFDFMALFYGEPEMKEFDLCPRSTGLMSAKTKIYGQDFHKRSKDKRSRGTLTFIDTMNYVGMSVEKMGRLIGNFKLEKPPFLGQYPKDQHQWSVIKHYNIQDSKISRAFISFLFDAFYELGASPKETLARTALSLFTNKYIDNNVYFRQKKEVLEDLFEAYYGGRTEAFRRGRIGKRHYYDINSLYPTMMHRYAFPDPNTHNMTYKNTTKYIRMFEGVSLVEIFSPTDQKRPLLPYRYNKKLIFPTGTFKGWYSHVELRKAEEIGYKILKVEKTHYYKRTIRPFEGYVSDLYSERLKYQAEGSPMEMVVKLLLNSLYGKFGQKYKAKDNFVPFNHTIKELDQYDAFERIGGFLYYKEDREPSNFCIPIWALYVTAYGRIEITKLMNEADADYGDTDSIICKREMPVTKGLGGLKEEMIIRKGLIIRPKCYALKSVDDEEHIKIKGVAAKVSYIRFERLLEDPVIRYKKFTKFREAVRRGLIPNEIIETSRKVGIEDDKRVWVTDFDGTLQCSVPIELKDGIPLDKYQELLKISNETFISEMDKDMMVYKGSDLLDENMIGDDITKDEYIENEMSPVFW